MKLPLLLSLCLLAVHTGRADTLLTLSDATGAPGSVTIRPGDLFEVTLTLDSTAEFTSGISYLLEADGSGSGAFLITGRDITNSAFPDFSVDNSIALSSGNSLLDPVNQNELGGLTTDNPNGIGSFLVANFTIQSLPGLAPGTYTIGTNSAFALDENFDTLALNRPSYSITVVPEPGATGLLALALMGAVRRRR